MVKKEIGITAVCIECYAGRGIDTSFQDDSPGESVLTAFQKFKSRNEFHTSYCVLFVGSMQVGQISEDERTIDGCLCKLAQLTETGRGVRKGPINFS